MNKENKSLQLVYIGVFLANILYIAVFYIIMKFYC
jgi:hypothetical protein